MASIIGDYPYLVVEEDGSIVGFAYAHRLGERAAYAWTVSYTHLDVYKRQARRRGAGGDGDDR